MKRQLTLYVRHGCHLCEAFLEELNIAEPPDAFEVQQVDVDKHPELAQKYGMDVPVLVAGERPICKHFFDPEKLKTYFEQS